jgi:hypothetical protein
VVCYQGRPQARPDRDDPPVANPIVRMSAAFDMKAIALFSEPWRFELAVSERLMLITP